MPVVALVSAKGSPGVTTAAAALTAAAHSPEAPATGGVLVELDPSGGDVEILTGAHGGEPSLLAAAADLRRRRSGEVLAGHAVEPAPGVRALVAPLPAKAAGRAVETVGCGLASELASAAGWVLVDAGRWDEHQRTANRLRDGDAVAVVCRSTAPSIGHTRDVVPSLRAQCPQVAVLLIGEAPYGRAEAAEVFDIAVLGPLAWDMHGVSALWARRVTSRWLTRTALGRSARKVLGELGEFVDAAGPGGRQCEGPAPVSEEPEGEEVLG